MSTIAPPVDEESTAQLHVATLRRLLAATGGARACATTLPALSEVRAVADEADEVTLMSVAEEDDEPKTTLREAADDDPITVLRGRPSALEVLRAELLAASASQAQPISSVSVPCFESEPEDAEPEVTVGFEEIDAEALDGETGPHRLDLDDTIADPLSAPPTSYIRALTPRTPSGTPLPFRPGGALLAPSPRRSQPPATMRMDAAPPLPAPSSPFAPDARDSVPPPMMSSRKARVGRLALAACLFMIAFASGAAIASATTAGRDIPHRVWVSVRSFV